MRHVRNVKYYVGCRIFKTYSTAEYYANEILKMSSGRLRMFLRVVEASK
jgi:hypothetical protein